MITKQIRDLVVRLGKEGESYRQIAKIAGIAPNTARNIILGKSKNVKEKRGPKRKLTKTDIVAIKRMSATISDKGEQVTAREIMKKCEINHVSPWTVRRAMSDIGYKYKKAEKGIVLSKEHKKRRLELAREWLDNMWPWDKVIWTDEKRFNLDGPDSWGSWMREGQKVQRNRRQQGGKSIQFWGMVLPDGKLVVKELHQWSNSEDYIEMLDTFVKPLLDLELDGDYILQQDNASIHVSKKTLDWMRESGIKTMDWPARSPDLSPIENVWSLLSQLVYKGPQFENLQDLREAIEISVRTLNTTDKPKVVKIRNSIQARLRKLIENKGDKLDY